MAGYTLLVDLRYFGVRRFVKATESIFALIFGECMLVEIFSAYYGLHRFTMEENAIFCDSVVTVKGFVRIASTALEMKA